MRRPIPAVSATPSLLAKFDQGVSFFRAEQTAAGPMFNNNKCDGCHLKDGRGALDSAGELMSNLLFKLMGEPQTQYGEQLQTQLAGVEAAVGEALASASYSTVAGTFADGSRYELQLPSYHLSEFSGSVLPAGVGISPRLAPSMTGMGLLAAVPAAVIRAAADPEDADGDGISGRAVEVYDPVLGGPALGRFGWKAAAGSVGHQVAAALFQDMGISSSVFPEADGTTEISDAQLALIEVYSLLLGVPERRGWDPATHEWQADVAAGEHLFHEAKCASCHTPKMKTGKFEFTQLTWRSGLITSAEAQVVEAALSEQVIYPYTDLLLHDMGGSCEPLQADGDVLTTQCTGLADTTGAESDVAGEWRTPPLWGIGLALKVNPAADFLHDGRAKNIQEAILWHGGEAAAARDAFTAMSAAERAQLLAFINSL